VPSERSRGVPGAAEGVRSTGSATCWVSLQGLREQGNAAFRAGNVHEAIRLYTEAFGADDTDYLSLSNRATAHVKTRDYKKALHDADECNALAPRTFVKHLLTKTTVLRELGRVEDARAAVRAALDRVPDNARAAELLRELEAMDPDSVEPRELPAPVSPPVNFDGLLFLLRTAAVMGSVAFMLSGLVLSEQIGTLGYLVALGGGILLNGIHSYRGAVARFGSFALSAEFAAAAIQEPSTPLVLLGVCFIAGRPMWLVLWPLLCYEAWHWSTTAEQTVPALSSVFSMISSTVMKYAAGMDDYASKSASEKMAITHQFFGTTSAQVQLIILAALLIELVLPTRNLIAIMLHVQNLMLQYAVNPFMGDAVRMLEATLRGYAHHPSVPTAVGSTYDSVVGMIASFGDLKARAERQHREAAASGGGGSSSCTVM
jgi:tetratricopeptide (TPR) repeat protein